MTIGTLLLITIVAMYFVPAWVADSRHHPQRAAIFVTNIFLGWTFLGWVAALIWAATAVPAGNPPGSGAIRLTIVALLACVIGLWALSRIMSPW
jgi:Superinfection immunity protein